MANQEGERDQNAPDESELGHEIEQDISNMSSVLGDAYRGELDRETTWRSRLDQTTTWGVTIVAAILTWAFSSPDNPHYVILVAISIVLMFLLIEARRYRDYDVYRSRVRLFQQNLLADALDPSRGVERENWRIELSDDYRRPTLKISILEAVANRLRRIYLALLIVLLVAWLFRVTAFTPRAEWIAAASIANASGIAVISLLAVFYVAVLVLAFWPRDREAMGEFRDGETGEWKN